MTALPEKFDEASLADYLMNHWGLCGCTESDEFTGTLARLLAWHSQDFDKRESYDKLFGNAGVFYILAGIANDLELVQHGGSMRNGWITSKGTKLLTALKTIELQ